MKLAISKRKSNGFGHPKDGAINFGFDELIAHATRTRRLTAGTSIGADTLSNADRSVGSACISGRRAIDLVDTGQIVTAFMQFGDAVRVEVQVSSGDAVFGVIRPRLVRYRYPDPGLD